MCLFQPYVEFTPEKQKEKSNKILCGYILGIFSFCCSLVGFMCCCGLIGIFFTCKDLDCFLFPISRLSSYSCRIEAGMTGNVWQMLIYYYSQQPWLAHKILEPAVVLGPLPWGRGEREVTCPLLPSLKSLPF